MLAFINKLLNFAFLQNLDGAVCHFVFRTASGHGAAVYHLLGGGRNINIAAGAYHLGSKFTDVGIALLVNLSGAQETYIQPAAIVKVKHIRVVHNTIRVNCSRKIHALGRNAAKGAQLDGE